MRGPIPGLVVSTMQSLNGDREPGHRRCRRRGRMMRGDAAAVTGAVPAVSLAATPFQLFAHRPLPVSHALGCRGHGLQAPSPPWGASTPNCLTVRRCRRMWVRGGRIWCLADPMARSRRSMERDVESRSWRSSSVAGAHSSATRTATESAAERRGAGTARSPRGRERDAARRCTKTYGWGAAGKRGEVARQGGTPSGSRRAK